MALGAGRAAGALRHGRTSSVRLGPAATSAAAARVIVRLNGATAAARRPGTRSMLRSSAAFCGGARIAVKARIKAIDYPASELPLQWRAGMHPGKRARGLRAAAMRSAGAVAGWRSLLQPPPLPRAQVLGPAPGSSHCGSLGCTKRSDRWARRVQVGGDGRRASSGRRAWWRRRVPLPAIAPCQRPRRLPDTTCSICTGEAGTSRWVLWGLGGRRRAWSIAAAACRRVGARPKQRPTGHAPPQSQGNTLHSSRERRPVQERCASVIWVSGRPVR